MILLRIRWGEGVRRTDEVSHQVKLGLSKFPPLAHTRWVRKNQNDQNQNLTKIISRSFGYGLPRKPLIFQARQTTYRARVPSGAAWRARLTGA
jgi:hypothetical protein